MSSFEQSKPVQILTNFLRPLNQIGGMGAIGVAVCFFIVAVYPWFYGLLNLFFTATLGLLLLAGEFNIAAINNNCKFLVTYIGRGFFNIFVGSWVFGMHPVFNGAQGTVATVGDILALSVYIVSLPLHRSYSSF